MEYAEYAENTFSAGFRKALNFVSICKAQLERKKEKKESLFFCKLVMPLHPTEYKWLPARTFMGNFVIL